MKPGPEERPITPVQRSYLAWFDEFLHATSAEHRETCRLKMAERREVMLLGTRFRTLGDDDAPSA